MYFIEEFKITLENQLHSQNMRSGDMSIIPHFVKKNLCLFWTNESSFYKGQGNWDLISFDLISLVIRRIPRWLTWLLLPGITPMTMFYRMAKVILQMLLKFLTNHLSLGQINWVDLTYSMSTFSGWWWNRISEITAGVYSNQN